MSSFEYIRGMWVYYSSWVMKRKSLGGADRVATSIYLTPSDISVVMDPSIPSQWWNPHTSSLNTPRQLFNCLIAVKPQEFPNHVKIIVKVGRVSRHKELLGLQYVVLLNWLCWVPCGCLGMGLILLSLDCRKAWLSMGYWRSLLLLSPLL